MLYFDTIVNAILILSCIIISKFDFFIIFLTSIGGSIYIYTNFMSNYFKKKYFLNNVFHVIFVQGLGAIALIKFYLYH